MKITIRLLERLKACRRARRIVKSLLPMTLYVNPEDNIRNAINLIEAYENTSDCENSDCHCRRSLLGDLLWLSRHQNRPRWSDAVLIANEVSNNISHHAYQVESYQDPSLLMATIQIMGIIADKARVMR